MANVKKEVKSVISINVDWAALAQAVDFSVMQKLQDDLEQWADDISMRSMVLADSSDGLKVGELLQEGNWKAAEQKLRSMDTAARDCVYDFIDAAAGVDFFDLMKNNG